MPEQPSILKSLGLVALLVALGSSATDAQHASSAPSSEDNVDARISRIEQGLLPAAIIRGQSLPTMTLAGRMKYYRVPEVSIAFFDRGQVAWARGYGLADMAANKPVTPETVFQAASVSKSVTALRPYGWCSRQSWISTRM